MYHKIWFAETIVFAADNKSDIKVQSDIIKLQSLIKNEDSLIVSENDH